MTYGILRNWRVRWHALKHAQNSITASRTCKDSGYPNGGRKHSFQNHRFAEVLPGYVTQTLLVRRKPRFVTQDQNKQDVGNFFWSLKKWRDSQRQKARN